MRARPLRYCVILLTLTPAMGLSPPGAGAEGVSTIEPPERGFYANSTLAKMTGKFGGRLS
jgi:hypothetical protein